MVGRQRPAYIIARICLIVMTAVLCPFFLFVGYMNNLLNGRTALSAAMAMRFEKTFGVSAETLMRIQTAYDLAQLREHAD